MPPTHKPRDLGRIRLSAISHLYVARRVLFLAGKMVRWLLVVALALAPATVWAEPREDRTDQVESQAQVAERRVTELAGRRRTLAARYEDELRAIDRLKKQRASWRRDREIQSSMSESLETAKQLAAVTHDLATAEQALATTRRELLAAVDAERPNATGARAQKLAQLHDQLAPSAKSRAKKIKIPNGDIDPLADPEELDEQAQQLRDSEAELQRQVGNLEGQAKELDRVATLRKQHERAGELGTRDDDTSHHSAQHPSGTSSKETLNGAGSDHAPAPTAGAPGGADTTTNPNGTPSTPTGARDPYESDATVVLSDVVDARTIDSLQKAQRSGDPAVRAAAARQARDQVQARLAKLKAQREAVEARSRALRAKR